MHIHAQFDSGNIIVLQAEKADDIRLKIQKDAHSDFHQWFHFNLQCDELIDHKITLVELDQTAYIDGWKDFTILASYDRDNWFRLPTDFNGSELTFSFLPEQPSIYFAYFVPYSFERHQDLLHACQIHDLVNLDIIGHSLDGRPLSLLTIGTESPTKKKIWLTARQHPGETMAEWFIEGLLYALLDPQNPFARSLLSDAVFYVIPNMNPDGSVRGHLRTNAAGINLNREWENPSLEKSPEVFAARQAMMDKGLNMYLDIHGDEALPYNFVSGCEGVPAYNTQMDKQQEIFKESLCRATPEFQTKYGYAIDAPNSANLTVASNWVGNHFKTLAYTVEMPFKDNAQLPDPEYGWNDVKSMKFGADTLQAIYHTLEYI